MMKYRKKPVVIEALVWDSGNHRAMYEFLGGDINMPIATSNNNFYIDHELVDGGLVIQTSEGDMVANIGDFIIKEPFDKERGFYPCKPDIFKLTYETIKEGKE